MDNYNELKDLAYKLDAMTQNNTGKSKIDAFNSILDGYENEEISFEGAKELMYAIFRGEIDEANLKELKNEYERVGKEKAEQEKEIEEKIKLREEANKNKIMDILRNDTVYCIHCGTKNNGTQTKCSVCDAVLTHKKHIFCPSCGELNDSMVRECIKCHYVIDDVVRCPVCKSSQIGFVTNIHNGDVSFAKAFWLEGLLGTAGATALATKNLKTKSEFIRKCINCGYEF